MSPSRHSEPYPAATSRRAGWLIALLLSVLTWAAYSNSFTAPFVFDDQPAILENPSLRRLSALGDVLAPNQAGLTTSGRPLLNLSFAINHAVSGQSVWGYHATNLAIHVLAGLCLFGLVRRTLLTPVLRPRFAAAAVPLSATIAALWLLHPLQTESVTYIVQRAESLAGLGFLLTLYAFTRAAQCHLINDTRPASAPREDPTMCHLIDDTRWRAGAASGWYAASVAACIAGVATKEVMVSAPLIVLLYDRTFVAGTFASAWRQRRRFYLALASSWLLLGWLVVSTGSRGGTAGFTAEISSWSYALTQCRAIVRYLALSIWPRSLVFDYGDAVESSLVGVLPHAIVIALLVAGVAWALKRRPVIGFCGAWFLALLAPSSSFVPIATQTMAEHRMYLPLAAVLALLAALASRALPRLAVPFLGAAALALGLLTWARNADYASEAAIWADTAAKWPGNARAHNNLGQALFRLGRTREAIARYERALHLKPKYPEPHYNLGVAFARRGEVEAAGRHYTEALRLQPAYPEAHNNFGNLLASSGRRAEAARHYEEALRLRPAFPEAHHNLGRLLLQMDKPADALARLQRAVELQPDYADAHYDRGNALAALGRMSEALEAFREALRINPRHAEAHVNAGNALFQLERVGEAIGHYQQALTLDAGLVDAQLNLGFALLSLERWADAAAALEPVIRAGNAPARAHRGLGFALARLGRVTEAIARYHEYLRQEPGDAEARAELTEISRR